MIVVAGEALVDLVADGDILSPAPGGGPFNTAIALGMLAAPVSFLGRLSLDRFGILLEERLAACGVDLRYVLRGPQPTPLALVHVRAGGEAEYAFYLSGTAYAAVESIDLPDLGDDVAAIHVGTIALATDPPASAMRALIERESGRRLIMIDPNIRPAVISNPAAYRERFEDLAPHADVIKLSEADAMWLYPGARDASSAMERLIGLGVGLVIVTRGAAGAIAGTRLTRAECAAPSVAIADTVGAGDAFNAAVLHFLCDARRLLPGDPAKLSKAELGELLRVAAAVAALACTNTGASPPSLADVEEFLNRDGSLLPTADI